jgi:KAP family P-loop domain
MVLFRKLESLIGDPIGKKLSKYVEAPDYKSRVAFIEQFHEDFEKIVKAYAGENTVYVFIDDLDRCEPPKAADLMQAINLMISDKAKLIFIIGMDRDQVAAALAVKQEKLLPYLDFEHASSDTGPATIGFNRAGGLEYGNKFIEKFIQLPFFVPRPSAGDVERWLREISGYSPPVAKSYRNDSQQSTAIVLDDIQEKIKSELTEPLPITTPAARPMDASGSETALKIDSPRIHGIVLKLVSTFNHNPRKMKQFINVFRLRAYIALQTGLIRRPGSEQDHSMTLEQFGKFVAISLEWPGLITDLDRDRNLLSILQGIALGGDYGPEMNQTVRRWSNREKLMQTLRAGCVDEQGKRSPDRERWDMVKINIEKLLQISPPIEAGIKGGPDTKTEAFS